MSKKRETTVQPGKTYECPDCGEVSPTPQAHAAHVQQCRRRLVREFPAKVKALETQVVELSGKLESLDSKLNNLSGELANTPTKQHLDEQIEGVKVMLNTVGKQLEGVANKFVEMDSRISALEKAGTAGTPAESKEEEAVVSMEGAEAEARAPDVPPEGKSALERIGLKGSDLGPLLQGIGALVAAFRGPASPSGAVNLEELATKALVEDLKTMGHIRRSIAARILASFPAPEHVAER